MSVFDDSIIGSSVVMGMLYYPPTQPVKQEETYIIPLSRIKLAKESGGEFIHKSGHQIYKWLYDQMYYADYDGIAFGSWFEWKDEDLPAGELREL